MSKENTKKYVFDEIHGYIILDSLMRDLVDTPLCRG